MGRNIFYVKSKLSLRGTKSRNNLPRRITAFFSFVLIPLFVISVFTTPVIAQEGDNQVIQGNQETATFNERGTRGFNPATIICIDADGNGWISAGECSWGSTSTPYFANPEANTQKGVGIISGGTTDAIGQTATQTINDGPHFTIRYYNAPSAPGTTYTSGVTSNPIAGNLRQQHNEFGFEVVVDKKTDPLEPYYLKFYIPYITVESNQVLGTGVMSGNATGNYYKDITEMDPNNPGVFNRYTVTGTFTSTGNTSTFSSTCQTGCTTDPEQWRQQMNWP